MSRFTQDIGFKVVTESWQAQGRSFAFAHRMYASIGKLGHDLELIALASDPHEWLDRVERLPFK